MLFSGRPRGVVVGRSRDALGERPLSGVGKDHVVLLGEIM